MTTARRLGRALVTAVALVACSTPPRGAAPVPEQAAVAPAPPPSARPSPALPATITISVLGLNDLHGRISVLPVFAGHVAIVKELRERDGGGVLLLDAGDMFQGTLEANLSEGESVIEAYRALGVHAVALGNHEFDFGPLGEGRAGDPQGVIKARIAQAGFPVLSANLLEKSSGQRPAWPGLGAGTIVEIAGVKVGVVGALTMQTPSIVMAAFFEGLDVGAPAPAVAAEAEKLRRRGADVVIALLHAGAKCQSFDDPRDRSSCEPDSEVFAVAEQLPARSVDAIVAGHTHAGVAHYVGEIPVVEAFSRGKAFSRVDLILDRKSRTLLRALPHAPATLCPDTTRLECEPGRYEGKQVVADAKLAEVIAPALRLAREKRAQLLGPEVKDSLSPAHRVESAMGNLLADVTLEAVPGADAAVLNGGSLRGIIPAGPLTYVGLYEAMPFENRLASVKLLGKDFVRILEHHLKHDRHGIVSLAGLWLEASCHQGALRVTLRRANGKPVRPDELLTIATSDYLATGGDQLFAPANLPRERIQPDLGKALRDAMAEGLSKRRKVDPKDLFDSKRPRLKLPTERPLVCN